MSDRFDDEISLLQAMYPDTVVFNPQSRELHYTSAATPSANITFRLPEGYPERGLPDIISARDGSKTDVRDRTKHAVDADRLEEGVEVLDQLITIFEHLVGEIHAQIIEAQASDRESTSAAVSSRSTGTKNKTVIIWLHHLLNTSKRKLAITPSVTPSSTTPNKKGASVATIVSGISGITKPGYPGVMIFSGPKDLVDSHVRELRAQNWQAFQVRWDSEDDGTSHGGRGQGDLGDGFDFTQGKGKIVEVESMAEVVKAIVKERDREIFLRAVGVK
ncbi:hypothetical protein EDD36DRAFT_50011 [Exophiala viscosa]|uniref:RWD domain-containing protein n=1 Tax=Exophiala viscosa TaxID=2486360 RepID=A0AAN6IL06_9EURO|nr:hypothetical protein EDD36DRAFT_50011 [Exophiala viscosa]